MKGSRTAELDDLVGRRVRLSIVEPSSLVHEHRNIRFGNIVRVVYTTGRRGQSVHFALVRLDEVLKWNDSESSIVSLSERFRLDPLRNRSARRQIAVNVNGEEEGVLAWADDDPRIKDAVGSRHIGFGIAATTD